LNYFKIYWKWYSFGFIPNFENFHGFLDFYWKIHKSWKFNRWRSTTNQHSPIYANFSDSYTWWLKSKLLLIPFYSFSCLQVLIFLKRVGYMKRKSCLRTFHSFIIQGSKWMKPGVQVSSRVITLVSIISDQVNNY
jgi:hypothetical protein